MLVCHFIYIYLDNNFFIEKEVRICLINNNFKCLFIPQILQNFQQGVSTIKIDLQ